MEAHQQAYKDVLDILKSNTATNTEKVTKLNELIAVITTGNFPNADNMRTFFTLLKTNLETE